MIAFILFTMGKMKFLRSGQHYRHGNTELSFGIAGDLCHFPHSRILGSNLHYVVYIIPSNGTNQITRYNLEA